MRTNLKAWCRFAKGAPKSLTGTQKQKWVFFLLHLSPKQHPARLTPTFAPTWAVWPPHWAGRSALTGMEEKPSKFTHPIASGHSVESCLDSILTAFKLYTRRWTGCFQGDRGMRPHTHAGLPNDATSS